MLAPGRPQGDLQQRQVARLVREVAPDGFDKRRLRRLVRVARQPQRVADGLAEPVVGNPLKPQDRLAIVGRKAFEQGLSVDAPDRLLGTVLDVAQKVK